MLRVTAWAVWGIALVEGLVLGLSFLLFPSVLRGTNFGDAMTLVIWFTALALVVLTFATAGLLIVRQRATHAVGWLMILGGPLLGVVFVGYIAGISLLAEGSPVTAWVILPAAVLFAPAIFLVGPAVASIFPDGRLPSPRWRWPMGLSAAAVALGSLATAIRPGRLEDDIDVQNPLGISAFPRENADVLIGLAAVALSVAGITALAALIVRYRRASRTERDQLKWFVSAVTLWAAVLPLSFVWSDTTALAVVATIGVALVPIAVVIAILRYRLYEIDRIFNRTLVYGGATVILAAAFGIANVAAQRALNTLTGQRSDMVTAALAVAAALAFGPMRRWMRPVVDGFLPARAELTLLFTDIVGSTRVAADIGDERWRSLLDRYRAVVRRELRGFGGREIDTAGDSFFATFDDPAAGVACAWRMRSAVRTLGLDTRSGLHLGQCEMRGETPTGLAVHVAARVISAAPDGAVVVSDAVRQAVNGADVELAHHGVHVLKGVPGEWPLYRVEALPTAR